MRGLILLVLFGLCSCAAPGRHHGVAYESALPELEEIVAAMPTLNDQRETIAKLLRGRERFVALAADLRKVRGEREPGVDQAVPGELSAALTDAGKLFESAAEDIAQLRSSGSLYPERLHVIIERAADEIRIHASGCYHRRRITVHQTEQAVADIFNQLLIWHKVRAGELQPENLVFPRSPCG